MSDIIDKIRELFINEAVSSPLLFNDLANMEKYISESYTGRSLIELLQNADDALASKFLIRLVDEKAYVVANDGRAFTDEDILALCRSGASTKKRKSNSIGFRGIGFKSIVNYAERVHLISGDIKTTFSRELTRAAVQNADAVPMIRIPHKFSGEEYSQTFSELLAEGYNTIFVFEVSNHSLSEEIKKFDYDVMLFLQSVTTVLLQDEFSREYDISRKKLTDSYWEISAHDNEKSEKWIVTIPQENDAKSSIAFKYDGTHVIEANRDEAVVHSFMPTHDALSIPIKINGDFSTDPSRTKVVIDEDTIKAADLCASIVSRIVQDIWNNKTDQYEIINILKKGKVDPLSQIRGQNVNDIFVSDMREKISKIIVDSYNDSLDIYLQPDGISNEDFESIANFLKIHGIGNRSSSRIPGLLDFLKMLGFKEIPLEKCLDAMKEIECSEPTREKVLVDTINKSRFGMSKDFKSKVESAKLISFEDGVVPLAEVSNKSTIKNNFEGAVTEALTTTADYTSFARTMGIDKEQLAMNQKVDSVPLHTIPNASTETETKTFSKVRVIKKWRSVEKNVAAVLELMDNVSSVMDVSTQNLGYDIEVTLKDGGRRFYEVKSVNSLGETFSFSNNEYSTAMQYKQNYFLAITSQNDSTITVCFIQDPVNSLKMTKRVTRWEWICDQYTGEVVSTEMK